MSNTRPNTCPTRGPTRVQHAAQHVSNTRPNTCPTRGPTRVQHAAQHVSNTRPQTCAALFTIAKFYFLKQKNFSYEGKNFGGDRLLAGIAGKKMRSQKKVIKKIWVKWGEIYWLKRFNYLMSNFASLLAMKTKILARTMQLCWTPLV